MGATDDSRRRGRPPAAPPPYPAAPMDTWLEELTPTAHRILRAARTLLLERGYEAVTLEAVALEAGEDKATITRHFGSKAGLLNALFDDLDENILEDLIAHCDTVIDPERRLHLFVRGLAGLATDRQLTLGMFELAPHILRDPVLRERFATLYVFYRKLMLEQTGMAARLKELSGHHDRADVEALPALVMAVIDGMSFQSSLDARAVDPDRVFALLDLFVSAVLDGRLRTEGRLGEDGGA
jgi:AcrR family transcriptional regulator